ncbi:Ribonuclease M5 [Candidatus Tiddalikarchaeum anstoanum]|nr:Ribonuclease M5 [Candidatus Tiddalikarchaeum anstoanum]
MLVKGDNFPLTRKDVIDEIIRVNKLVIVEGQKDVSKLKKFGIFNVEQISRMPLYSFAEKIAKNHREVIILTDNDKAGSKLYSKLKKEFLRLGVTTDGSFRKHLAKLGISHVEGL